MTRNFMRCLPAFVLALAVPMAVHAAGSGETVSKQVSTAAAHAGMALGAGDLQMAHTHLHHVVNCLVGASGEGFDAKAGNPCAGMGQGAIADAEGDAATTTRLQEALTQARDGLQTRTLDEAHADARAVVATLQKK
jgi:hypothetical protein